MFFAYYTGRMVEKEVVREGYDELAPAYADQRTTDGVDTARVRSFIEDLSPDTWVLDAGCGQGEPVLSVLVETTTAVGLDVSIAQLELARTNVPDSRLCLGDMACLPYTDGVFDAVVCYWSLIHVPMDEHRTVIEEFARVLAPGGRLLVSEGTSEWVGETPDWLDTGVSMEWEIAGAATTHDQLERAGFVVTDRIGVGENLECDADADDASELPWTVFEATLADTV